MITAKSQPFTPAYPWGTRTGTAAKATPYRTKTGFVKDIFTIDDKFYFTRYHCLLGTIDYDKIGKFINGDKV